MWKLAIGNRLLILCQQTRVVHPGVMFPSLPSGADKYTGDHSRHLPRKWTPIVSDRKDRKVLLVWSKNDNNSVRYLSGARLPLPCLLHCHSSVTALHQAAAYRNIYRGNMGQLTLLHIPYLCLIAPTTITHRIMIWLPVKHFWSCIVHVRPTRTEPSAVISNSCAFLWRVNMSAVRKAPEKRLQFNISI